MIQKEIRHDFFSFNPLSQVEEKDILDYNLINIIKVVSAKGPKSKEMRVTSTGKGNLGPRRAGRKLSRDHNICVTLERLVCIQVWKT